MDFRLNPQKVIFILITAVLLAGLVVLAGSLSQVELSSGNTFNILSLLRGGGGPVAPTSRLGEEIGGQPLVLFVILFWAGLVATIIYALVSPQFRRRALATFILVAVILFFFTIVGERLAELQGAAVEETPLGGDLSASPPLPEPPAFVTDPPDWIIWVVAEVVALLLVAFGIYIWTLRRQIEPDPRWLFVQEAEQALQELEAGNDLKDVVLRCYTQMESVMRQSQAIERRQSMTPREFEDHLLRAGFHDAHIGRLVRLFEEVRYGARPSDGRAEREARDCLSAIVASFGKPDLTS
jgi:hypothetical protein